MEGAELMSFRVLWFVVAGFVIGFTTSTLWEWLYYRRKRLAMLEEHSEFVRDAQRHHHAPAQTTESTASAATEWRPPIYRSPGVFLESEQPAVDSTFTGTAFIPAAAPTTAAADAASSTPRATTGERGTGATERTKGVAEAGSFTPQRRVLFPAAAAAFVNDEMAAADQGDTDETTTTEGTTTEPNAATAVPYAPRMAYRTVTIVDTPVADTTLDDDETTDDTVSDETDADETVPDAAASTALVTDEIGDPVDDEAQEHADQAAGDADFNVVDLTPMGLTAAVLPSVVEPPLAHAPPPTPRVQAAVADLSASTIMGETAERRPRTRPDDYPDDLAMIKGIGEAYKRRLYATGIYTWRQVAESDLDSLRRITRAKPNADIQSWQTQARELAEKYHRWEANFAGPLDDLTQIDGIGAITADMLYKAGICTYGALGQASPDELARIVPAPTVGNENDFEGWIREAARLDGVKRKNQGLLA